MHEQSTNRISLCKVTPPPVQYMFACQHLIAAVWLNKFICMIQLSVCLRGLMTSQYDAMNGNWIPFSGFSVGCCIIEKKVICYQLEFGRYIFADVSTECSSRHRHPRELNTLRVSVDSCMYMYLNKWIDSHLHVWHHCVCLQVVSSEEKNDLPKLAILGIFQEMVSEVHWVYTT